MTHFCRFWIKSAQKQGQVQDTLLSKALPWLFDFSVWSWPWHVLRSRYALDKSATELADRRARPWSSRLFSDSRHTLTSTYGPRNHQDIQLASVHLNCGVRSRDKTKRVICNRDALLFVFEMIFHPVISLWIRLQFLWLNNFPN